MGRKMTRPLAALSMDLDNQWSYMKTHGDEGWETLPSYLDVLVPYALDLLEALGCRITFFVVGRDAASAKNHRALSMITGRGHEVGNHSFEHEPWLHLYSSEELYRDIHQTDQLIRDVTGQAPVGFRGPGFSWSNATLEVLADHGYLFDASSLPSFIGPLARMYYFWTSRFSPQERKQRDMLFGRVTDGFRRLRAHHVRLASGREILEIPVTTVPLLRVPFHLSYLVYLNRLSPKLMEAYLEMALVLCQLTGTEPSFLLHPLDLLGGDQVPELRFFPGMDVPASQKRLIFETVIRRIGRTFRIVPMGEYAAEIARRNAPGLGGAA
jgi:peptidoglycan-N-acetylglucosamine deacetylase